MDQNLNLQVYTVCEFMYHNNVYSRRFTFENNYKWETETVGNFDKVRAFLGEPIFESTSSSGNKVGLFGNAEHAVYLEVSNRHVYTRIASNSVGHTESLLKSLKETLTVQEEPVNTDIAVNFWYNTASAGPRAIYRKIAAPFWEDIKPNYAAKTKLALEQLMTEFKPKSGGQLILWHGKPGTGKTYALRALCQSWKEWCSAHYILDPEHLFGFSPGYFANLVIEDNEEYDDEGKLNESNWKLLILEDTGELLTEDAQGQGLARLLNLVDGFIGQGLRVLVLITTNVEFEKLHPAVTREGRCAAEIKFVDLSWGEASSWMKDPNLSTQKTAYTLAELFAMKNDSKAIRLDEDKVEPAFGFKMKPKEGV